MTSAALAAIAALAADARAQLPGRVDPDAPAEVPAPAPVVAPPRLLEDPGAVYPVEGLGTRETVVVVLVLSIDAAGAVTDAVVESVAPEVPAKESFARAAADAARALRFAPATRDGVATAARIKHRYELSPPPGALVVRALGPDGAPLAGATVTVVDPADPGRAARTAATAADGVARFDELAVGALDVEVTAPGLEPQRLPGTDVRSGEEARAVVRLAPAGPAPGTAGEPAVEEVRVVGRRPPREITRRTLEQRELSRIPGTNGDALRAVQNLPGVARPPGIAGLLIVRGSAPNATNVFVDGTLVPIVYHFGGLSSVVPTEFLDRIDFYPGNFSSQYGRVTGGVIDIGLREPRKDRFHGLAQLDLVDGRVLAEGPLWNTGWTVAVAGRRSWLDAWLGPVLRGTGAGVTAAPVYYDYQLMVARDFGKDASVRVALFGSDDRFELLVRQASASGVGGSAGLHTAFWRLQARYKQRLGPDTEAKAMVAIGQDVVEFGVGDNRFTVDSYPLTSRLELSHRLAAGVTANVGLDTLWSPYDVFVRLPPPSRPGEPPAGPFGGRPPLEVKERSALYRPAVYAELELTPFRGTRVVPGVRLDYSKDTRRADAAPRVVARQDLASGFPRTTVKGGVGLFFQPPQPQETTAAFGVPGSGSARAVHYGLGAEQEITRQLEVSVEGFYKDLSDFFTPRLGAVATGRAFGMELLLRYKPDARFFGWLAYTLSRSSLRDSPGEPERLAAFDQTHIMTVLGSYRLGGGWEIGARFRLVSGNPTTSQTYGFLDENAGTYLPLSAYPPFGERLPAFHQLDVRVDKTWEFSAWRLRAYLDVQNVYNAGNVEGVNYNFNQTRRTYVTGIPILPSLGVRAEL